MYILISEAKSVCIFLLARPIWYACSYKRDPFGVHILISTSHLVCIFLLARPICYEYSY